jgi:hypothetical protein
MNMYARLRYLILEGFDICSLMGYDEIEKKTGEACIVYRSSDGDSWQLHSERFQVGYDEMQACSQLFLDYLSR